MDIIKKYLLSLLDQLESGKKTPAQVGQLASQIQEALGALESGDEKLTQEIITKLGLQHG